MTEEDYKKSRITPIDKISKVKLPDKVPDVKKVPPETKITSSTKNTPEPLPKPKPKKLKKPSKRSIAQQNRRKKEKTITLGTPEAPQVPDKKQWSTGAKVAFGIGFLSAFAVIAYTLFKVLDARKKSKKLEQDDGDYDEEFVDDDSDETKEETNE